MNTGDAIHGGSCYYGAQGQLVLWDKAVKDEHAQVAWGWGGGVCTGRNDSQEVSLPQ